MAAIPPFFPANKGEGIAEQVLQKKGATLTKEVDCQGWTPLHYAAYDNSTSMVKLLLKYDRSAAYSADRDGKRTPLHIAVGLGYNDIVEELISCCPDCCKLVDMRGRNILHIAIDKWSGKTIKLVLQNSSLTNILNEKDNKAREHASPWACSQVPSPQGFRLPAGIQPFKTPSSR
ncbi:hypothetical protein L1049_000354 [Liquidambar formosana]|uniref:Ankyrin repeat protein n=1 Tax=Liquidambar formosana TaxID=63359 RepID=A0AAP0NC73_LIQFO